SRRRCRKIIDACNRDARNYNRQSFYNYSKKQIKGEIKMTKQTKIQKHLDNLNELTQENNVRYADGTEYNIYDLKELMSKELVAIEEIQEEEQVETALTVDELKKMGEILGDMRKTIELY